MKLLISIALSISCSIPLFADFKLVCPPDITISCTEDYSNLDRYGEAYTEENGHIKWQHDCKIVYNIDECGVGTIMRTWGVMNPETFLWETCSQWITLSNANAFGYRDISFPPSITIESCNPADSLKRLPRPYDRPSWRTNKCAKPMLNYSDQVYKISDGCVKIERTWKILDWCVYDPFTNPGRGIFTGTQIIKLITKDNQASIVCLKDTLVLAEKECNGAEVILPTAVVNSSCNMPYTIKNTSPYAKDSLGNASGFYPIGTTRFYIIAEYGCGSVLKCEVSVTVQSKIQPTPYCLTGVIVDLMPIDDDLDGTADRGMAEIWASDLDKGSFHKCPGQKLRFSFSKDPSETHKIFTCDELGDNEVEIWVTDSLGNQDFCKTVVTIQNNTGIPDCKGKNIVVEKSDFTLALKDAQTGKMIQSFKIQLENQNDHQMFSSKTNHKGEYFFQQLEKGQNYRTHVEVKINDRKNIDQFDLMRLKDLVLGRATEINPYKLLAADMNADGQLTHHDVQLLEDLLNSKIQHSELPQPYVMVPESHQFGSADKVLAEYASMKSTIISMGDQSKEVLLVIKTGDLNSFGASRRKSKVIAPAE
ncbi:MAG: hypothetical protein IPM48_09390 [Saprospiraceae bacterium]|nr:hypothetical protein [Saprospiraceae bacterium]